MNCFFPGPLVAICIAFLSLTPQSHSEETEFEQRNNHFMADDYESLIRIVGAVVSTVIIVTIIVGISFLSRKRQVAKNEETIAD
ncbi:uncharacterized protein LOC121296802 isoform X2 [Polyodon spathula]|uniref:uncharacterized protein LOC121296802 isoform X2 n=1 Tax=Polyodon spathula TaxID=7913 RepID=UPI001B7DA1C5|nr:uncharacterized protein LOC121296802 isoform X2 [Polyodon spathula]